jgi:predicted component of type VI protein secretion system
MERQIGSLVSIMEADRETDRDEMKQIRTGQEHIQDIIRTNQEKMEAMVHSMRSELDETIQHQIKNIMTHVNCKTQSLQKELTKKIEKTQVELQAVEVFLNTQARKLEEDLATIRSSHPRNYNFTHIKVQRPTNETH